MKTNTIANILIGVGVLAIAGGAYPAFAKQIADLPRSMGYLSIGTGSVMILKGLALKYCKGEKNIERAEESQESSSSVPDAPSVVQTPNQGHRSTKNIFRRDKLAKYVADRSSEGGASNGTTRWVVDLLTR